MVSKPPVTGSMLTRPVFGGRGKRKSQYNILQQSRPPDSTATDGKFSRDRPGRGPPIRCWPLTKRMVRFAHDSKNDNPTNTAVMVTKPVMTTLRCITFMRPNISSERPPEKAQAERRMHFRVWAQAGTQKGTGGSTPLDS